MKNKIFFIVSWLFVFIVCIKAQETNMIVNEGVSWATLFYVWGADDNGNTAIVNVSTAYHFFEGDTVADNKTYRKLYQYTDKQHINRSLLGFMREENKKTYFVDNKFTPNFSLENILYDFSLTQESIFKQIKQISDYHGNIYRDTAYFYVQSCDLVLVSDNLKKRLILAGCHITPSDTIIGETIDTIIENVGSLHGFLYPYCYNCTGAFQELLCYHHNNELIYKNPSYSECYYDKPEDITFTPTVAVSNYRVFPNPVDNVLTIYSPDNVISQIEIFDISGRKIHSQKGKSTINVSTLYKGLYLLKLYDINEQVSFIRIIKN